MTIAYQEVRVFQPGTTGWSASDLNDPEIERLWFAGPYEIVDGVLTTLPAAYGDGSFALNRLRRAIEKHLESQGIEPDFAAEADFIISPHRVARPDLIYMTAPDIGRQRKANAKIGRRNLKIGRILVPPTLIIESVSPGHEAHDAEIKREWYAPAKVPNYWILNAFKKSLDCLILEGESYTVDCIGRNNQTMSPALFPGLVLKLGTLWM